ncbi:hypothetical protein J6590_041372 [Homalodisca vitripennis]|nr:hypothetical protein J6590_100491 [Homalodisca vitripennis]KAG8301937.1 hypothetical protein J6590_041372 [Homalodisca vitripennis]
MTRRTVPLVGGPQPSSLLHSSIVGLRPTRILGGVSISESAPAEVVEPIESSEGIEEARAEVVESIESSEGAEEARAKVVEPIESSEGAAEARAEESSRDARYMKLTPAISSDDKVEIKDEPSDHGSLSPLNVVHNLIHGSPVTHYKTKTLWVTKVEKVFDTRVTATLLAQNCVPTNSHIPLCAPHGGLFAPGYHGGIFAESFGGHFLANILGDKFQGHHSKDKVGEESNTHPSDEKESTKEGQTGEKETEETD